MTDESHRSLFEWLAPVDPKTNHEAARRLHEPGTGSWICQTSYFTDWEDAPSAALWIHAKRTSSGLQKVFSLPLTIFFFLQLEPARL